MTFALLLTVESALAKQRGALYIARVCFSNGIASLLFSMRVLVFFLLLSCLISLASAETKAGSVQQGLVLLRSLSADLALKGLVQKQDSLPALQMASSSAKEHETAGEGYEKEAEVYKTNQDHLSAGAAYTYASISYMLAAAVYVAQGDTGNLKKNYKKSIAAIESAAERFTAAGEAAQAEVYRQTATWLQAAYDANISNAASFMATDMRLHVCLAAVGYVALLVLV